MFTQRQVSECPQQHCFNRTRNQPKCLPTLEWINYRRDEKELTAIHIIDESHEHDDEHRSQTHKNTICSMILFIQSSQTGKLIKFKSNSQWLLLWGKIGRGCDGGSWGNCIVLFLDLRTGYTGVCSGKFLNYRLNLLYISLCNSIKFFYF